MNPAPATARPSSNISRVRGSDGAQCLRLPGSQGALVWIESYVYVLASIDAYRFVITLIVEGLW